jgi:hypothetical protein
MSRDVREALRAADRLFSQHIRGGVHDEHFDEGARRAAYDALVAALDACSAMPGSEAFAPGIAQRRLVATDVYKRTEDECERALQEVLRIEPDLVRRVMSTLSSCKERPALLARYMPYLMAELEQAVHDDPHLWQTLEYAREARVGLAARG